MVETRYCENCANYPQTAPFEDPCFSCTRNKITKVKDNWILKLDLNGDFPNSNIHASKKKLANGMLK